jgi:Lrp/AsnC family leucine-responsive transcriptional regulator
VEIDRIDREIIAALRADGRASFREMGEQVGLSANTVADRVRRLQAEGVIQGIHARVDLAALGLNVEALIDVKLLPATTAAHFEAMVRKDPAVVEVALLTGSYDYLVRVACRDHAALVQVIEAMRANAGVQDTHSRVVLRRLAN